MRKVSVILLNYNSHRFTFDCIASIQQQTQGVDYEIIIVDNNSSPTDADALRPLADVPGVRLIRSRINLGFSGGNMLGVQAADPATDYYYFLNNDCVLRTNVLAQLTVFMDATPDAGLCGAQMFAGDGSRQETFGYLPTAVNKILGHGVARLLNPDRYPNRRRVYTEPVRVPFIMGSTLFVRASVFHAIGGFDVAHFLYVEEEDLAKRLLLRGFYAYLVPQAEYVHFTGQSTVRNYDIEKEHYISLFYYFRKYHSWPERALLRAYYVIKNGRKFRRNPVYGKLAWFIGRGSPMRESLRYRQTIREQ
ncbi:glycosyltransferase family 2 protein [Spirosoma montaniterrae]|uniref:Family 2 glycosyl transferase n=1 Tax=Spirosoma montaniterrae TaxID=1178516 RepID=A0A1P9WZU7_9BACT|nr:glycosyltransferase family 2 protein [Spirosoma montaniterrae]AQG80868.1 family 2 glycosyl transferase [Spirosoma montaniterrae]